MADPAVDTAVLEGGCVDGVSGPLDDGMAAVVAGCVAVLLSVSGWLVGTFADCAAVAGVSDLESLVSLLSSSLAVERLLLPLLLSGFVSGSSDTLGLVVELGSSCFATDCSSFSVFETGVESSWVLSASGSTFVSSGLSTESGADLSVSTGSLFVCCVSVLTASSGFSLTSPVFCCGIVL